MWAFLFIVLAGIDDDEPLQAPIFRLEEVQRVIEENILVTNRGAYEDDLLRLCEQQLKKRPLPTYGGATVLFDASRRE